MLKPQAQAADAASAVEETNATEIAHLATHLKEVNTELTSDIALLRGQVHELKTELKNNISLVKIEMQEVETRMMIKLCVLMMITIFFAFLGRSLF